MLETKPLELIYQGTTNVSQVLSPFSASPPKVLLSGFRSRCHIVIKGAFPEPRVQQGLDQLIHWYTCAGFPKEELQAISNHILIQHQNLEPPKTNMRFLRAKLWFCSGLCPFLFFSSPLLFLPSGFPFSFLMLTKVIRAATWLNFPPQPGFLLCSCVSHIMDHAQGRAFHHHLARAIMHLKPLGWSSSVPSNRPLNGTTPCLRHTSAWNVQTPEASTRSFLYLPLHFHQPWCHMEVFHHS